MLEGSKSAVRDGKDTLFWTSNWVDSDLRLIDLVESSAEEVDLGETVADFTTIEGQWDFERLSRCLPTTAVDSIAGMSPPNPSRGEDVWIWGREESGEFSIRSAYELICNPFGGVTLNSDGSVLRGKAAAGGLFRDSDGRCLAAYAMNLGSCTITRAEIRGALEGIKRAWEAGYRKLEVQLDSKAVVAILSDRSLEITHGHALEVLEFREWMSRDWELNIRHVYREENFAADHLASRGHELPRGSHWIDPIDCRLAYFVRYDCMGLTVPRLIIN
ncbi:Putative ribonuclease H protein At1g65750 [Linum perenne]